jgi:hypothetical protein
MTKRADQLQPGDTIMLRCPTKPDGTSAEQKLVEEVDMSSFRRIVWLTCRPSPGCRYVAWPDETFEVLT